MDQTRADPSSLMVNKALPSALTSIERMSRLGIYGAGSNVHDLDDAAEPVRVGVSMEGRKFWKYVPLREDYASFRRSFLKEDRARAVLDKVAEVGSWGRGMPAGTAQGIALRNGNQQLTPEHLIKALLDDKEGLAANLMKASGADPAKALAAVEKELDKLPKVGPEAVEEEMRARAGLSTEQAQKLLQFAGARAATSRRRISLRLCASATTWRRMSRPDMPAA